MQPRFNNRNLPRHTQPVGRSAARRPADEPADVQPAHWYAGDSAVGRGTDMAAGHSTFSRPTGQTDDDDDKATRRERQERDKKFHKGSLRSRRFMGPGAW